jgi:hypothetical protein
MSISERIEECIFRYWREPEAAAKVGPKVDKSIIVAVHAVHAHKGVLSGRLAD